MKAALIQSDLAWENPEANRIYFSRQIGSLNGTADLIVLPEMFTTGFTMNPKNIPEKEASRTLEWMRESAMAASSAVVGSLVFQEGEAYFNRMIFMFPNGQFEYYDKRHTFTLAGEDKVYNRGRKRKTLQYGGLTFSLQVCYDLRFPVWSRNTDDYDVLLYVANWPNTRISAWDTLLRARAIENMSYVVGVNRVGTDPNGHTYTGHSAVYDPLGTQLAFSDREAVLEVTLDKSSLDHARSSLKFLQDRDTFSLES